MRKELLSAMLFTALCVFVFSGLYPLILLAVAAVAPGGGLGNTIQYNNRKYYINVGQAFSGDQYFWSRPSAVQYNASGSGGSNKGPSDPEYLKEVSERIDSFLSHNPVVRRADIPSELVTASGSGLDPDLSPEGALVQVHRVACARSLPDTLIRHLVHIHCKKPLFGPGKVNLLELNIALDRFQPLNSEYDPYHTRTSNFPSNFNP